MLISEVLNKYIQGLEQKRVALLKKYQRTSGWYFAIPILASIASFFMFDFPPAFLVGGVITAVLSAITYTYNIGMPFAKIKSQLKDAVLKDLMETFHPHVEYTYSSSKQDVREIAKGTGFFRANRYKEEDVIQGNYENIEFYISEVHLSRKKKKSRTIVFDGLLFKIKIPEKIFPAARITSRPGLLAKIFGGFQLNEEFGFYYDTENDRRLQEAMGKLFPFFQHLIKTNKDVRVSIQGNEIVMFLKSRMQFLDDPQPKLKEPLINNNYVKNFAQQLNSLLFIVESLVNDLDNQDIEERLKLKVLEYADYKKV